MSKAKARVFVPLTKVDEEQRLVYGVMTQEVLDKSGEMMDYDKSKPHFQKWSNDIHEASGGLSKGNLRVMHGLNVAGKVTEMEFDDDSKTIEICTKVVDDGEWNKVLEGCYTGFSVGGSYGKRWNETIDGATIKKYEAKPNEVSLVDNPCVPSATFSLVKADGHEEEVMFKAASAEDSTVESDPAVEKTVTNEQIASRATELAKEAGEGKVWTDFIEPARDELTKAARENSDAEEGSEGEAAEAVPAAEAAEEAEADNTAEPAEKVTPPGIMQKWTCSDGQAFEKKDDALKHEATLEKAAPSPPTEAEELAARLSKALNLEEEAEELPLMEDFDRLSKAVQALITPFEEGEPKLEKGMYTVNRFSSVLSDMASLSRSIKAEGKREGDDASDSTVSGDIIAAVKTLGTSFLSYATNQVTELLAGMDDDVVVSYHDYYYNAAQADPANSLAKDVTQLISDLREPAKEARETLVKVFGLNDSTGVDLDELSPPMQKRFDLLEAENAELKKVATEAVDKVEDLAKRMKLLEDTPQPRAPNGNVALKEGDATFLGKSVETEEDRMNVLRDMLANHGADGMATLMIKAAQQNGQKLSLKQ